MDIRNIIEKYIFKIRYIVVYRVQNFFDNDANVSYISMANMGAEDLPFIVDNRLYNLLKQRAYNSNWIFFYYLNNNEVIGYSFLHTPSAEEWNDSLPTLFGEARISSNFVHQNYRGRGIRGIICKQQINYANEHKLTLWCVIERSNKASLRAEEKFNISKTHNYLIKIGGRNIFSVKRKPFQLYTLLGDRRAHR